MELSDEENGLEKRGDGNNGYRSDEAEEDGVPDDPNDEDYQKSRRIDPSTSKKRVVRNPQPKLNAERIQGPKGVQTIEKYFEGFKFQGKGHEKSDLDKIMKRLEHWAHRLFPKYQFDDFLEKMEILGSKKNVQVYLKKYRLGMETPNEDIIDPENDAIDERGEPPTVEEAPADEFDKLIAEQIEKQRRVTDYQENRANTSIIAKPSSNVLGTAKPSEMSDEIKMRIENNRKLAIERKNARLKKMEEESKKRKFEESQDDSQTRDTSNVPIANSVFSPEKRKENFVSTNVRSPIVDSLPMEISSRRSEERVSVIEKNFVDLTSDLEKNQSRRSNDSAVEKLKNKNILDTDTIEILEDEDSVNISKSQEKSIEKLTDGDEFEEMPDDMEFSNVDKTYGTNNEKSKDDSETLLSKEDLQKEIDNAIEEIINRNAQKNK